MVQNYVFMTDSDSDLPYELKVRYDIPVVSMPYTLEGKEYFDDLGQTLDSKSFFDKMRAGAQPSTSALNETIYLEYFEPVLAEGKDLLFVAFSSQLSGTINAVYAARETLLARYPERKFMVVDTLSISGPMTILILKAHELYRAGKPMEEVAAWLEENKLRAQAWFTVDDLKYLKRGGRISSAVAAIGTMLDLKPILTETCEGKLASADKVRGRRKAMNYIVDKAVENVADQKEAVGIILHADAIDDAQKLRDMLAAKLPDMELRIDNVGPVIGTHAGPGTLAFCFLGKKRPM
ncbi:MAG: DegV family protein [Eubacteriales bacterium]|nr:DegV family protein [Eubacteriales bacterium]